MFWVAALVISAALLWLLSPVLLPFIAGMVLAYLLDPVTRRVERTGLGRVRLANTVSSQVRSRNTRCRLWIDSRTA